MASSSSLRPSTPPLSSNLHTPTTPKHGWEDNYQPYSPRKSSRVSSQRARAAHTPPHNLHANPPSPNSAKKVASVTTPNRAFSPPSSRMGSRKRAPKASPVNNDRKVSDGLAFDSTVAPNSVPGIPAPSHGGNMEPGRSTTALRNNGMLPTPAKTPTQKPTVVTPGIKSIARNLFPIRGETAEDAMPSPKKKGRKQHNGYTLGSFGAEDEDTEIAIYTDSHDRIPEADLSADNPFYGQSGAAAQPEPTKRSSKRRKIAIPGEGEQTIEEAERREDGLIYVFRGKKTFRKFNDTEEDEGSVVDDIAAIDAALEEDIPSRLRRPLTRSSVKPRLLFPTPEQLRARETRSHATEDEEEAVTDIEEPNHLSTPKGQMDDAIATPKAPKFAPASPPTTTRVTRSKQTDITGSPAQAERDGSLSPFRHSFSLGRDAPSRSRKRGGESLKRGGSGKKIRGE